MQHKKQARHSEPVRWVAVSGGFDPIHVGHIRLMREARALGDKLVVVLNNDAWLQRKKGFAFMPQHERVEVLRALPFVDKVVLTDHTKDDPDMSVGRMLKRLRPAVFANGGDRTQRSTPEDAVCRKLGIRRVYEVGRGGKVQSSSWLIRDAIRGVLRSVRPWGEFYGWNSGKEWYLKTVHIKPRQRLSLQYHHRRSECWVLVEGDATATVREKNAVERRIPLMRGELVRASIGQVHRLESKRGGTIVEIAFGVFDENDIVRLEDDHGRI